MAKTYLVKGRNFKDYEVDLMNDECTCGHNKCYHQSMIRDIFFEKGNRFKYDILSAFHKELRRGAIDDAFHWGRIYATMTSPSQPKSYAKSIILEETRNIKLLHKYRSLKGFEWEEIVTDLCKSRKKWELTKGYHPAQLMMEKGINKRLVEGKMEFTMDQFEGSRERRWSGGNEYGYLYGA